MGEAVAMHVRRFEWLVDYCRMLSEKLNKRIYQLYMLVDINEVTMWHGSGACYEQCQAFAAIDQAHYPETNIKILVTNAGMAFKGIWQVLRMFVHENTANKFSVKGSQGSTVKKMLETIAQNQIPQEYGGSYPMEKCLYIPEGKPRLDPAKAL